MRAVELDEQWALKSPKDGAFNHCFAEIYG
ncbi:MAG: hypothetical protein CM1200mP13_11350 [Candidatus Pelagibacterales bacterium]|nr:MAG: hypothetical protein CM1200mP13_11350 [Pelagibacterales bacterium]